MRAARRLDIDLGAAERAGLGRGRGRGLFGAAETFELMDALDDQEHEERHNQEINDRRDKSTVLNGGAVDTKYVIIEVGAPEEPDNGREDVLSQRGDKAGKGAAARSSTLPRRAKALNSCRNFFMKPSSILIVIAFFIIP